MATKKTDEQKLREREIEKERKKVLEILLKKTGLTYNKLVETSVDLWVTSNIDLLTASDKKQFKYLVF
ncbi:MAG: hypothetical protein MJZ90_12315 [Bacteroidales bacterium]|nr:hypothetical protein [Bacteroidales bacterium]